MFTRQWLLSQRDAVTDTVVVVGFYWRESAARRALLRAAAAAGEEYQRVGYSPRYTWHVGRRAA